jgi:hypothetical protein
MRLAQVTGLTANGKSYWSHPLPQGATVAIAGKRMLVVLPDGLDYWLHEDGSTEMVKPYPKLHSDDGA